MLSSAWDVSLNCWTSESRSIYRHGGQLASGQRELWDAVISVWKMYKVQLASDSNSRKAWFVSSLSIPMMMNTVTYFPLNIDLEGVFSQCASECQSIRPLARSCLVSIRSMSYYHKYTSYAEWPGLAVRWYPPAKRVRGMPRNMWWKLSSGWTSCRLSYIVIFADATWWRGPCKRDLQARHWLCWKSVHSPRLTQSNLASDHRAHTCRVCISVVLVLA